MLKFDIGLRVIEEERLIELLKAEQELIALENNGVDTWQWYSTAMSNSEKIGDNNLEKYPILIK